MQLLAKIISEVFRLIYLNLMWLDSYKQSTNTKQTMSFKEKKEEKTKSSDQIFDKLLGFILKDNASLFECLYRANLSFRHSRMVTITSKISKPSFSRVLKDPKNKKPLKRRNFGCDEEFKKARKIQQFLTPKHDFTSHVLDDLDRRISTAGIPYFDITDLELVEDFSEVRSSCNRLACLKKTAEVVTLAAAISVCFAILILFVWFDSSHLFWEISLLCACGIYLAVFMLTFIPYNLLYKKTLKKLQTKKRLLRRLRQRGRAVRAIVGAWTIQKSLPEKNIVAISGPYGLTIWLIFISKNDVRTKEIILDQMIHHEFRPFKIGCDKELRKLLDFNAADLGPYLGYGQNFGSKLETITAVMSYGHEFGSKIGSVTAFTKLSTKSDLKTYLM